MKILSLNFNVTMDDNKKMVIETEYDRKICNQLREQEVIGLVGATSIILEMNIIEELQKCLPELKKKVIDNFKKTYTEVFMEVI